jgi:hypothetical protein
LRAASIPASPPVEAKDANALCFAFGVALVLISIPIKNFAYLVPLVYLLCQALVGDRRLLPRVLGGAALVLLVSALSLLIDSSHARVNVPGLLMGMITYLPLMIAVCHPRALPMPEETLRRLQTMCAWFVIVQSLIGLSQFAISRNPDSVCGTFGLLDFRYGTITISQVYFTFTVFSMLLFLLLDFRRRLNQAAIGLGLLACVLAHSGHQTIFLGVSLLTFGLLRISRPRTALAVVLAVAVLAGAVHWVNPDTLSIAIEWREKIAEDDSPKRMALDAGRAVLDDTKNLLLGTGIGQFSSRAALISSNEYLSTNLPGFLVGKSTYFTRYIEPANDHFEEHGEGSAISKPYCSLISIPVETGLMGTLLLGGLLLLHLLRNSRRMLSQDPWLSRSGLVANVGLVFFVLCCAIENYAEFAQAIFLPLLIYVAVVSRAATREEELAAAVSREKGAKSSRRGAEAKQTAGNDKVMGRMSLA